MTDPSESSIPVDDVPCEGAPEDAGLDPSSLEQFDAVVDLMKSFRLEPGPKLDVPHHAVSSHHKYVLIRQVEVIVDPPLSQLVTLCRTDNDQLYLLDRPTHDRFRVTRVSAQGGEGKVVLLLGHGSEDLELLDPSGLAVDAEESVYVPDAQDGSVKKYSADGRWLATFRSAGARFNNPHDIDVADDGSVYVTDTYNNRIVKLTGDGERVWELERFQNSVSKIVDDELYEPGSIAVGDDGRIVVADTNQNRIVTFNAERELIGVLDADGSFEFPSEVKTSHVGELYVADYGNLRVQRFNVAGQRTGLIDLRQADTDESIAGGGDIELDAEGHVILIDPIREAVVVLDFVALDGA